jgi:uncharacterized damage-inducible protein DinB
VTRKEEILAAYNDAWSYKWESLTAALSSISEEEAEYQHPIYADAHCEEGLPASGSILWHIVHLADCYRHYVSTIERRPDAAEEFPPPEAHSLSEAISILKRCRMELRNAIDGIPEEDLDDEVFNYGTIAQLARMTVRHDAWHGAQIVVAKRLYRMR